MRFQLSRENTHNSILLLVLFYVLGAASVFGEAYQIPIQLGGLDDAFRDARSSVDGPKRGQFTLRYAFHHDMQDLQSPPELMAVDPSARMVQLDGAGQPTLMRPLDLRFRQSSPPFGPHNFHVSVAEKAGYRLDHSRLSENGTIPPATTYPDITDRDTIINLAKMTSDAYIITPDQPDWLNTTLGFNHSYSFGWKGDGLRGHVFSDLTNETVIVVFKGTSVDPRDKWQNNDRVNDNILFSCCCAEQRPDPYPYGAVCGCRSDVFQCNSTCLTQEILGKDRYYPTALAVMHNVSSIFSNASFWTTGHSMGGAVASLMGRTFDLPTVTFESPPERLPAGRLGLTTPPRFGAYHFGNTADPIFQGACNGWSASCSIGGYAFESQCFTGKKCAYDTMADFGWRLSITNHRINYVITEVLEKYEKVATCEFDDDCVDCFNWKFNTSSVETLT